MAAANAAILVQLLAGRGVLAAEIRALTGFSRSGIATGWSWLHRISRNDVHAARYVI